MPGCAGKHSEQIVQSSSLDNMSLAVFLHIPFLLVVVQDEYYAQQQYQRQHQTAHPAAGPGPGGTISAIILYSCPVQCSTAQYSAVRCSSPQCKAAQCIAVKHSKVQ